MKFPDRNCNEGLAAAPRTGRSGDSPPTSEDTMETPERRSKRTGIRRVAAICLICTFAAATPSSAQEGPGTSITVYPQGLGLVRLGLERPLAAGTHAVRIDGLPTSVEQASLVVLNAGTVLRGVRGYRTYEGGSAVGASLIIDLEVSEPLQALRIAYLAGGLDWAASYTMQVAPDERSARLDGYASITNGSGARFTDAELQLLAGDVNVVAPRRQAYRAIDATVSVAAMAAAPEFQQESFGGYHLYTASESMTLEPGESRRIRLMGAEHAPVVKEHVLMSGAAPRQRQAEPRPVAVAVRYRVARAMATEFGTVPLPAGTVRIYKPDGADRLQLLGMAGIDNTPAGQEIVLPAGRAFDLTGVRSQTGFRRVANNERQSDWSITLSNASDEETEVQVIERIGGDWTLLSSSHDPQIISAAAVRFDVTVPAGGDAELRYSVSVRN